MMWKRVRLAWRLWLVVELLAACRTPILEERQDVISTTPTLSPVPNSTPTRNPTPTSTLTPGPVQTAPGQANKAGIHLLLDDGRNAWPQTLWRLHLEYARRAVGDWGFVTELVRLDDLDVTKWQFFFDLCAELHLIPVLRLATTFDRSRGMWLAPVTASSGGYHATAEAYAAFVASLHWPAHPHFVVVGNEPNHGDEWGGLANPREYARFLLETAVALRQADPAVKIINAPLDPFAPNTNGQPLANGATYLDAESFLDQMLLAQPDILSAIDVWGTHSYPLGPLTEGPWSQSFQMDMLNGATNPQHRMPPAGLFNRGTNAYAWELFKLAQYGPSDLPVMITETGWRHLESTDLAATDTGPSLPEAATVAAFMDMAFRGNGGRYPQWPETGWLPWNDDPRVIAVTPFALDGYPGEWGHTNWLQLNSEGSVLGVYPMFSVWGK